MENKYGNHFQNVLAATMLESMQEALPEDKVPEIENRLRDFIERNSWATQSIDVLQSNIDGIGTRYLEPLGYDDQQVRDLVVCAAGLTQQKILNAPIRIYNDYGESGAATRTFLSDVQARDIRFGVCTSAKITYVYHKEEYGDVDLIYGFEFKDLEVDRMVGKSMEYLGFVSRKDGQAYALKYPANSYWFHEKYRDYEPFTEEGLKKALRNAVRQEVISRVSQLEPIATKVNEFEVQREFNAAIKIFSKNGRVVPFAERIEVGNCFSLTPLSLVRFIIDRDAIVKELADRVLYKEDRKMELQREKYAVEFAQCLLDQMNESVAGKSEALSD